MKNHLSPLVTDRDIHIVNDFNRDVYCLFGFPVDNLTFNTAVKQVAKEIQSKKQKVLATLNLNWIVLSMIRSDFRAGILKSDICVIDGKPLLFISRILGLPMREVIAGSSLMSYLQTHGNRLKPISVFLLGGNSQTAETAFTRINSMSGGLTATGYCNPGFGSVDELSTQPIIDKINTARPDFLLVALGACKGTLWIDKNRRHLTPCLISHLGATIHFLGGTLERAPVFFQKTALEWFWRIFQEPVLIRRYLSDGIFFIKILISRLSLFRFYLNLKKMIHSELKDTAIILQETQKRILLKMGSHFIQPQKELVRKIFYQVAVKRKDLIIDFRQTTFTDASFLAYFLLLLKHQQLNGKKTKIINVNKSLEKILILHCVTDSLQALGILYEKLNIWHIPRTGA